MVRIDHGSAPPARTEPPKPPDPPKARETPRDRWRADDRFERAPSRGPLATPTATPPPPTTPTPVAPPTPPDPTATPTGSVYVGGLTRAELAALQQDQGGRNDCAEYAIAAGLNLLFGGSVRGSEVAAAADQVTAGDPNRLGFSLALPWGGLRWSENGMTTPWQQANIVNGIARQSGLPLSATVGHSTTDELIGLLGRPDTAVIVTLGWSRDHVPQIALGNGASQPLGDPGTWNVGLPFGLEAEVPAVSAHAMLLAAHDPSHMDLNGNPTPWGFVNSWADGASPTNPNGATDIYWMSDTDFRQAYNFPIVGNAVVITREAAPAEAANLPTAVAPPTPPEPGPTATPTPDLRER